MPAVPASLALGALLFLAGSITAPGLHAASLQWTRHAFPLPESIWSVAAIDADADGHLDLIAMGQTKVFVITPSSGKSQLLFDSIDPKMLYCVALDSDGDGDLDLAIGRYRVPWIDFREARRQSQPATEPRGPDFSVGWIENTRQIRNPWPLHIIDRELNGIHGLCAGDVNGDGLPDLLADSIMGPAFPNSLVWFQNSGKDNFQRHVISRDGADGRPHYLDLADLNADGRPDLLLGDSQGGTFTWWEQSSGNRWIKHLIAREKGATNLRAADLNSDGVPDTVGSCGHGQGVFWFEGPDWKKHPIDPDLPTPHALATGDFDGDGDGDVAVASLGTHTVRCYLNDGQGKFIPFDIDTGHRQQAYDLKSIDLDRDGRLDLILAGRESNNAVWYQNQTGAPKTP